MNKKGFMRILEAIIAIIIALGFVIIITPTKAADKVGFPPDLDETTNSILREMQDKPQFRNCVLGAEINFNFGSGNARRTGANCVKGYIDFLTRPIEAHPWNYAVKICKLNDEGETLECDYEPFPPGSSRTVGWNEQDQFFNQQILPTNSDVYIKSTTLSYPDVTGEDIIGFNPNEYRVLTLYAWSKA